MSPGTVVTLKNKKSPRSLVQTILVTERGEEEVTPAQGVTSLLVVYGEVDHRENRDDYHRQLDTLQECRDYYC